MKKMILVPAAVLLFGGMAYANSNAGSEQQPESQVQQQVQQPAAAVVAETQNAEERIGFDKAEEIARGIQDGQLTDIELERDGGKEYYDIEIYANGYEYDIEIDAYNGEVLKNKREKEDDYDKVAASQKAAANGSQKSGLISADEAIQAALQVVSGTVKDVELDEDDGRIYYEIEIENRYEEHEVKVDATDGSILEVETDIED